MYENFPVFLVIDDGGRPNVRGHMNNLAEIPFSNYMNILKLAKRFNLRIPIGIIVGYLDIYGVAKAVEPVEYADKLVKLLTRNKAHLEIVYHGLTHTISPKNVPEFLAPYHIQRDHIEKSIQILKELDLKIPKYFVPPANKWIQGITDNLLSRYGVKYIVSVPRLFFNSSSQYMLFLPRASLGINFNEFKIKPRKLGEIKLRIINKYISSNLKHRLGINLICNLWCNKLFSIPHSYSAHVPNFASENIKIWEKFFNWVHENSHFFNPSTIKECTEHFLGMEGITK